MNPFDTPEALRLNQARMEHLESLNLPIQGKAILDIGCGPGYLAQWFKKQGCYVLGVDARLGNVSLAKRNGLSAQTYNIEREPVPGRFDIVFCYGLLYHLESPMAALRNMVKVSPELLLLESIVCDHPAPLVLYEEEEMFNPNQSVTGLATRPTAAFIVQALKAVGFEYVWLPRVFPQHEDFLWESNSAGWWPIKPTGELVKDMPWQRDGHNLRRVFVASKRDLENDSLVRV